MVKEEEIHDKPGSTDAQLRHLGRLPLSRLPSRALILDLAV